MSRPAAPPTNKKKPFAETLTGLVDALCEGRVESERTIAGSVNATEAWFSNELENCKKKFGNNNRRKKKKKKPKKEHNNNHRCKNPLAAQQQQPAAVVAPSVSFESPVRHGAGRPIEEKARMKVEGHRVKSLRKELKKRGLETGGLKRDLQARLCSAIVDEEVQHHEDSHREGGSGSGGVVGDEEKQGRDVHQQNKKQKGDAELQAASATSVVAALPTEEADEAGQRNGDDPDKKSAVPPAPAALPTAKPTVASRNNYNDVECIVLDGADDIPPAAAAAAPKVGVAGSSTDVATAEAEDVKAGDNTSSPTKGEATASNTAEASGRKRGRSPVRQLVQSAIKKFSATASKSPLHKKHQTAGAKTTDDAMIAAAAKAAGYQLLSPPKVSESATSLEEDRAVESMEVEETQQNSSDKKLGKTVVAATGEEEPPSTSKGPVRILAGGGSAVTAAAPAGTLTTAAATTTTTPWSSQQHKNRVDQMKEKVKAQAAAREARNAAIREKSKPAAVAKPITTPSAYEKTLSSLKSTTKAYGGTAAGGEEVKRKQQQLTAAMREKAALGQHQHQQQKSKVAAASAATTNFPAKTTNAPPHSSAKKPAATTAAASSAKKAMKSPAIMHSAKKKKIATPKEVQSPLDTYEISDHEGDTDSDDEENAHKNKAKKVPNWARKANLTEALNRQFTQCTFDPDEIFGEVETCNLQEIFNQDKNRYKQRTSSGIWTRDRATSAEKIAYKRAVTHQYSHQRSLHA